MKEKMYCYNCDQYVDTEVSKVKNKYTIHNVTFQVEEDCYKCIHCHEELIDETLDHSLEKIYNKYLENYHLSISKLKEIRTSLNLSQELFAKALGWSKKTITRYENGQSLPQKEYLTTYQKLQDNKDEILNILMHNKEELKDDYYEILNKVSTNMDIKTIHAFRFMLNDNPLYETQMMKHLYALDFLSQSKEDRPLTSLKYAHAPYGPIIDNKNEIVNYLLKNNHLQVIFMNDDKVRFISTQKCDTTLFTKEELALMEQVKKKLAGKTSNQLSEWSHNFEGWKETKNGEVISYTKYGKSFDLEKGW